MARFDVHLIADVPFDYVVDVQANILSDLKTRVVIPLVKVDIYKAEEIKRLKPTIDLNTELYILMTTDIAAIETHSLGEVIANIEHNHRDEIINALDFLFQGF